MSKDGSRYDQVTNESAESKVHLHQLAEHT